MTTIFSQMHCDAISPAKFRQHGHGDWIRFYGLASLAHVGNVVDVDPEACHEKSKTNLILFSRICRNLSSKQFGRRINCPISI
jgi:hypothetical protein